MQVLSSPVPTLARTMKRLAFVVYRHMGSLHGLQRIVIPRRMQVLRSISQEITIPSSFAPDPPPLQLAKQFSYQISTSPMSKEDIDYFIRTCELHKAAFTVPACRIFLDNFTRIDLSRPGIIDLLNEVMSLYATLQERGRLCDSSITDIMVVFDSILTNEHTSRELTRNLLQPALERLTEIVSVAPPITDLRRLSMCYYSLKNFPVGSPATHALLSIFNESLIKSADNFSGRALARMFRGVSEITSSRGEVKQFCNIIAAKLSSRPPDEIANVTLSNMLSSMRSMQSGDIEVRRVMRLLGEMLPPFRGSYNGSMLASMITGMRLMDSSHVESRLIVRELVKNFKEAQSPIFMGPKNISAALYGFQRMKPLRPVVELLDCVVAQFDNVHPSAFTNGYIEAILYGIRYFNSNIESVDRTLRVMATALSINSTPFPLHRISAMYETMSNKDDADEATHLMLHQLNIQLENNTAILGGEDIRSIFGGIMSMTGNSTALMDTLRILSHRLRHMKHRCPDAYVGLFKLQMMDASLPVVLEISNEIITKLLPFDVSNTTPLVALAGFLQIVNFQQHPEYVSRLNLLTEYLEKDYIPHATENLKAVNAEHLSELKVYIEMLSLFNDTIPEQHRQQLADIENKLIDISKIVGPKAPYPMTLRKSRMLGVIERWLHENGFQEIGFNTVLHGRDVDVQFIDPRNNTTHAILLLGDVYNQSSLKNFVRNKTVKYLSAKYGVKVHALHISPHALNTPTLWRPITEALESLGLSNETVKRN